MEAADPLITRITMLEAGLGQARHPLTAADLEIDRRLRDRIRVRIGFLIDQELAALNALREDLPTNDDPMQWKRFAEIRAACRPLFRECLALIQGTSTRRTGLDRGLCAIADALLDDLSHRSDIAWGRFTILDTGESFGEMAEIIRLRFPNTTIWDLPVAAHEFGHFLAPRLQRRGSGRSGSPIIERLNGITEPQHRLFLHEHFADVLATVALGPAWAFTALLLRLDPFDEGGDNVRDDPRSRHPPDDDRAQVILAALHALDDDPGEGPYALVAETLSQTWLAARQAAGRSSDKHKDEARVMAGDMLAIIFETLPGDLRFPSTMWEATESTAAALAKPGKEVKRSQAMTLQHILNASWRARLQGVESMAHLEQRSLSLCNEVAARIQPVVGSS